MQLAESISFWSGVMLYAAAFVLFMVALIFTKAKYVRPGVWTTNGAFALHTMSLVVRWVATGHPPFVAFFESVSAAAWFAVLAYLILQQSRPGFTLSGAAVTGAVFLMLGWASTPSIAGETLAAGLRTVWLFIHATFATAAVGLFLVAAGISALWLWRGRNGMPGKDELDLPSPAMFDETAHRYILLGFLFYTIMLASGAVWANNAWGRYWGWDPIETWSLISWVVYGIYLHLHFTYPRLRGAFTAWYAIGAVLVAAFSLWGVGYLYRTIHNYG